MAPSTIKPVSLLENISTAVLVFDSRLALLAMNAAAENLLLVSSKKVLGQQLEEILPDARWFAQRLRKTFEENRPYTEWGVELNLFNQKSITVGCMVTPLMNGDSCREIVVELIDADSFTRVMREESVSAVHDAARKSFRGMAHEIKNPLGGLRGAAQLLERELGEDSELIEYTQIIIKEADRLRNLIDRMLGPESEQALSEVNIHEILEYVTNLVQAEADPQLDIMRDYDPSLPVMQADKEQLIQAFINVFRNAIQAIGDNGHIWVRTRIKRRCTIRQQYFRLVAQIEIIDDGEGIPPEIESEVFYPLVTGRPEGTGLGLSIAQSLIQLHDGSIAYERDKDKTIFRILLPLDRKR